MSIYSSRTELDIDLGKYLLVLQRRWLPAMLVLGTVTTLSVLFATTREPTYYATGKVLVKLDRTPSLAGLDIPGQKSIGEPDAVGLQSDPIATEVETILSLSIAKETISELALRDDSGIPLSPEDFFSSLEVNPIPGTDMIRIGYQSTDPELAAAIVNKIIEVYRNNNIAVKQSEAIAAREFITRQLPNTEQAVYRAETALRQFKEQNQIVVLSEESVETVKAIQQLDGQINQAKAQLATVSARSTDLQKRLGMNPQRALQATALSQSPAIQDAFTQIRAVQGELDLARSRYRSTHPAIAGLERQQSMLQDRLKSRVAEAIGIQNVPRQDLQMGQLEQDLTANLLQTEVERIGLMSQINQLSQLQANQRQRANAFPRLEATQRELERRLNVAQSTYEALLQRLQEVQVAENQTIDNIRVVSQALVPEQPNSSKKLIVLAGVLVGTILAAVVAFAIDLSDRSVKTVGEARDLLGLPILGVVPLLTAGTPNWQQSGEGDITRMTQAYRMLQANLGFVSAHTGQKVIVITSSVSAEGRSQVAANLAVASAQAGNRVLVIDADLQQPTQHRVWNCQNGQGLVDVLGAGIKPENAIQTLAPNLHLLSAGDSSANHLAAFNIRKISALIEQIGHTFDLILIDTPPLTQTADASILGTLADGTLMVVRPRFVQTADVKAARGLLRLSGQHVLGMVINGVEHVSNPSQYFAYATEDDYARSQPSLSSQLVASDVSYYGSQEAAPANQ